jgi:hypothetical protein
MSDDILDPASASGSKGLPGFGMEMGDKQEEWQ